MNKLFKLIKFKFNQLYDLGEKYYPQKKEWHQRKLKERRFAYMMKIVIPRKMNDLLCLFSDPILDFRAWFRYNFHPKHRYHILNTGLEPGYHESDNLILYANFQILKDFIEIEKAGMSFWLEEKKATRKEKFNQWCYDFFYILETPS